MTPVVPLDFISLGLSDAAFEKDTTSMLALCDGSTTHSRDLMIPRKGLEPHGVRDVCVPLQELSYIRMTLKSDGESSITARETVQKEWAGDSKNFPRKSISQERSENDHVSTGALESKESGAREGKSPTGSAWDLGVWLSRSTRLKEHLICTRMGVIRARMAKRRPQFRFWGGELQDAMISVLWLIDCPVVTPESGLEFSSGCKACDEERSAVKRRDRSFNHSTESNERQADSRARLREMKMLSAGDASCFIFITCVESVQWNRFCVVWPECTRRTVEFKF